MQALATGRILHFTGAETGARQFDDISNTSRGLLVRTKIIGTRQQRTLPQRLSQSEVSSQRIEHMLPGANRLRMPDLQNPLRLPGPDRIRNQTVLGPIAPTYHIAGPRGHYRHTLRSQKRVPIAVDHHLAGGLTSAVRIVTAQPVLLAEWSVLPCIMVDLVRGYHYGHFYTVQPPQRIKQVGGAHDICTERFQRGPITRPDQGLGRQVKDNLRPRYPHQFGQLTAVPDIAEMALAGLLDACQSKQIWPGVRDQADTDNLRPQLPQPERQPGSFKPAVPGEEDAFASPKGRQWQFHQVFQGALPDAQRSSSIVLSRNVSMGCQNPRCS